MHDICVGLQCILIILECRSVLWETLGRFETHACYLQVGILADIYWFMASDKCLHYNIFFKGGRCPVCILAVYCTSLLEQYLPNVVNVNEILCKGYPKGIWLDL